MESSKTDLTLTIDSQDLRVSRSLTTIGALDENNIGEENKGEESPYKD